MFADAKQYASDMSSFEKDPVGGYKLQIPARTAQGGGSFKDRKPIGEVGCRDAWMAEQIH